MSADVLDRPVTDQGSIPSKEDVEAALLALGNTAEEVAQGLHTRGITGRKRAAWACPLANYLTEAFPSATQAVVFRGVTVYFGEYMGDMVDTTNTDAGFAFIDKFDEGHYAFLEER